MSLEKPINPMEPALRQRLIDALSSILPAHCLKTEDSQLRPYESDGLAVYRRRPAVVALPETVEQVQQVMRLCRDLDIPVVARGLLRKLPAPSAAMSPKTLAACTASSTD